MTAVLERPLTEQVLPVVDRVAVADDGQRCTNGYCDKVAVWEFDYHGKDFACTRHFLCQEHTDIAISAIVAAFSNYGCVECNYCDRVLRNMNEYIYVVRIP